MNDNKIKVNDNKIKGLAEPSEDSNAANRKYVDAEIAKISQSGGGLTNPIDRNLDMARFRIINLGNPTHDYHATNKLYVDDQMANVSTPQLPSNAFVTDGSRAMTGNLNMGGDYNLDRYKIINLGNPASNNDAANKLYVAAENAKTLPIDGSHGTKNRLDRASNVW